MAEMTKQEWLQRLQEELKTFQKIIFEGCDRLQGIIRETRKELKEVPLQNQKRPEDIPIQRLTATEMAARREKGLCYCCDEVYKFGHQCTKRKIFMFIDDEESDEETEEFVKEIKPPDSTIVTGLAQRQEVPAEASIDAKETKSWPKPTLNPNHYTPPINLPIQIQPTQSFDQSTKTINLNTNPTPNLPTLPYPNRRATIIPPNQNLPTLSYPNPKTPHNQTQVFQTVIQDTAAHLVANRPSPWPNKPPINTNTNTNRPKPWPDEPPIHTDHKLRTSFDESRKLTYKHGEEETSRGGEVSPSLGLLWFSAMTNRALKLAQQVSHGEERPRTRSESKFRVFSVAISALHLFQNRVLTVAQLRVLVIEILRHLPEFEPGIWKGFEGGLKGEVDGAVSLSLGLPLTKPDGLFRVLTVVIQARKLVRHRFCAEIQLPTMKTVSARHFQTFFVEVNQILKKLEELGVKQRREYLIRVLNDLIWGLIEEEIRDLRSGIGHFNPRDFSLPKKKKFGILKVNRRRKEVARVSNYLMWEFPRYSVGFVEEEAAIALPEEEEDFGCVEERRSMKKMRAAAVKEGKQTLTPNPISKHSVLYCYNWARWIPIGELGQKHNWALSASIQFFSSQRLGRPDHLFNKLVSDSVGPCQDWVGLKIINSFSFGDLGHQYIWATIAIDFPFQVP